MLDISFGDIKYSEELYTQKLSKCYFSQKNADYIKSIQSRSNESSRTSSLCALYELYCLLEKNGIDASNFEIKKTSDGKPYFVNCDIYFSISHTDTKFAVAICDSPIGIDIEDKTLTLDRMQGIAKRYFTKDEIEYISDRESFLKVWTFKEAYAKMKGVALSKIIGKETPHVPKVNITYNEYNGAVICVCYE